MPLRLLARRGVRYAVSRVSWEVGKGPRLRAPPQWDGAVDPTQMGSFVQYIHEFQRSSAILCHTVGNVNRWPPPSSQPPPRSRGKEI